MTDDGRSILDRGSTVDLDNGYLLGWAVDPAGTWWPWLAADICEACERAATHGSYAGADHERTGRLPVIYRDRLGLIYRCGANTWHGEPCRIRVSAPGDLCTVHARGGGPPR